ncbi:hypothetical protein DWU98_06135 [Dyella monticola]|uniref:Uncharacterized protein n=1 Tax=Dyella monticola TaxID=1927958 RepID=A0A370X6H9_9GAMM|nr:hypothetical protein [Dyella monticola]RDS83880.1 hypothetical protein DWU98_06135 [Dyella monticola]
MAARDFPTILNPLGAKIMCDEMLVAALVDACQLSDSGARDTNNLFGRQILPAPSPELPVCGTQRQWSPELRLGYTEEEGMTIDLKSA